MTHELKILPQYYEEVLNGNKTFEIRKNDRDFMVNDTILFRAWDGEYLNKPSLCRRISYVLKNCPEYGLMDGYVILGLDYICYAVDEVEKLPPVRPIKPKEEWIPVSEKLPEMTMACICTMAVGKLYITQAAMYSDIGGRIDHRIFYQGDYGAENFENITQYVKAWMPLPEPYMPKGEE